MSNKRKRDHDVDDKKSTADDFRRQRQIVHTFDESAKQLARAFKIAKGFERQKLGRRKKQAARETSDEGNTKDLGRIDAEINALKALDPIVAAEHYLAKSLLKIKAVAASTTVLPAPVREAWTAKAATVTAPQTASTTTTTTETSIATTLNVSARLCNSKAVKEALPTVWTAITRELGVEIEDAGRVGKKKRLRKKDFEKGGEKEEEEGEDGSDGTHNRRESSSAGEAGGASVNGDMEDSEDEFAGFEDRLASSSSDDGSYNGDEVDVEELERQLEAEGVSRKANGAAHAAYDYKADLSLSDAESDLGSLSSSQSPAKPPKTAAPTKSAFLPSLTMGGYISGSGSDLDEDEVDTAPRKNRRGQRARQQIWEKKYGTGAKHLQKQDRNKGWDPRRGATDGRERGKKGHGAFRDGRQTTGAAQKDTATGANAFAVQQKPRKREDIASLHPSWQAAKRAKQTAGTQVAFQGKKISFD